MLLIKELYGMHLHIVTTYLYKNRISSTFSNCIVLINSGHIAGHNRIMPKQPRLESWLQDEFFQYNLLLYCRTLISFCFWDTIQFWTTTAAAASKQLSVQYRVLARYPSKMWMNLFPVNKISERKHLWSRNEGFTIKPDVLSYHQARQFWFTLPIAKLLSVKNERAWVSMVSYLKKINEN